MSDPTTPYYAVPKQPRLIWNDRDKRKAAEPLPTQTVEIIRPFYSELKADKEGQSHAQGALEMPSEAAPQNRLLWTNDNLVALTSLLHGDGTHAPLEGKVDLVYIDPPFAVQSDFKINVEIESGLSDEKLPTLIEEIAYSDTWKNGLDSYLSMMRDRLELLKRLLAPTGSIYVHCDWHAGHYLKVLLDEVFGYDNFQREIVWDFTVLSGYKTIANNWIRGHDVVYYYTLCDKFTFNKIMQPHTKEYLDSFKGVDPDGRKFLVAHKKKRYLDNVEAKGKPFGDVWDDVKSFQQMPTAAERVEYPTQKPLSLLQRIIAASSNPGDLVLDCFSGSGTTAVAAETMRDAEGKAAPRRWIAIDNGKFAIHLTRKRLIEANARPFAVENVGFYARSEPWQDKYQNSASAKQYRDAMVEVYGGAPVEGYAYLHGTKGARWIHVGPMNAPVVESQLECIVKEAAGSDIRSVDVLSADVDIDFNKGELEAKYGVSVQAKIIPHAAVEAVRERLKRKRAKDPKLEAGPEVHFFSPPDIEVRALPSGSGVTVTLTRLTVDLEDCLSTQDAVKRAEIKARITDWKVLVDYWAVDWDYDGQTFQNDWQTFRTRKSREIAPQAAHAYPEKGDKRIAVKVTDIFGNDGLKVIRVTL